MLIIIMIPYYIVVSPAQYDDGNQKDNNYDIPLQDRQSLRNIFRASLPLSRPLVPRGNGKYMSSKVDEIIATCIAVTVTVQ